MDGNINKHSQGSAEYLLTLTAVLIVAALTVYYLHRAPASPPMSAKAAVDSTGDIIIIEVYSGSVPANEWEYSLTQTQGTGTWVTGDVALAMPNVNLENKATTSGTWYVSLRHKASGHEYFDKR